MKFRLGHHVYGLSAIALGVITFIWRQIDALGSITHPEILVYVVVIVELVGGLAIQWQKTVRFGALTLVSIFLIFSLYWIPQIVQSPLEFWVWGNFFEQFSLVVGCVFVFVATIQNDPVRAARIAKGAYLWYGVCVLTYAFYQLFYLTYTANLVPKWIPPGQMFWAVATTIAFALAAFAMLSGRFALLASRLLTLMIILFGLLVWVPPSFANPHTMSNWRELAENYLMAGASWIVADFLVQQGTIALRWPFDRVRTKHGRN